MTIGDKVEWVYLHSCGWSSWYRRKIGVIKRFAKNDIALVQFEYNKTLSRIPCNKLKVIEE
jgi:hypothetical protein